MRLLTLLDPPSAPPITVHASFQLSGFAFHAKSEMISEFAVCARDKSGFALARSRQSPGFARSDSCVDVCVVRAMTRMSAAALFMPQNGSEHRAAIRPAARP